MSKHPVFELIICYEAYMLPTSTNCQNGTGRTIYRRWRNECRESNFLRGKKLTKFSEYPEYSYLNTNHESPLIF